MISRMSDVEMKFPQENDLQSRARLETDFDVDLMLNSDGMLREIKKLLQHKQQIRGSGVGVGTTSSGVPLAPHFLVEQCMSSCDETVASGGGGVEPLIIVSWQSGSAFGLPTPCKKSQQQQQQQHGYVLEIDDGTPDGPFKQVYCGSDSMCQIKGLESNAVYNFRVKAYNQAGFSDYSQVISIPSTPRKSSRLKFALTSNHLRLFINFQLNLYKLTSLEFLT